MDPLTFGAVMAGTSILGGLMSNNANKEQQQSANDANAAIAAENRAWQERMANSAHQREIADLKAAGLNPILSASKGGSATPAGNAATMQAAKMEDVLGKGVNSALSSLNLQKDLDMAESQKALNASAIETQQEQQNLNATTAMNTRQQTLKLARENNIAEPTISTLRDAATQQAQADLKRATIDNKMATYDAVQKRVDNALGTVSNAKDAINPLKGMFGRDVNKLRRENSTMKDYINKKTYNSGAFDD